MIITQVHTYTDADNLIDFIQKKIISFSQQDKLLVQVFFISTDETYMSSILDTLNRVLPKAHIIGTTTDGSILHDSDFQVTTISFSQFEKSILQHILVPFELTKEDKTAQIISQQILNDKSKVLILFADGLLCNVQKLTQEIHKKHPNLTIAGGMAGDNAKLEKTFVCDNSGHATQAVVALSIESDSLHVHNDYNLAWEAVGKELEVTKAEGNIIHEIDGENASGAFEKYLNTQYLSHYETCDSRPTIGIEFPFIMKRGDIEVTRTVFKTLENGSVYCTAELQDGDKLNFSYTNNEKIVQSGLALAKRMRKEPVETIFAYSCMARRRFMGENIVHDIEPLTKIAPLSGFYSYGEIFTTPTSVEITGHTMTVLALSEEAEIYSYPLNEEQKIKSKSSETLNAFASLVSNSHTFTPLKTLNYNAQAMQVSFNDELIKMSKSESALFEILFKNKNKAINSHAIFNHIWGESTKEFSNDSVRALIKKLRKKLPEGSIENIYGGNYKLVIE